MPRSIRELTNALLGLLFVGLSFVPGDTAFAGPERDDERGKCLLWKVESGAAIVYLLGSVHVAKASMYPLDATIERAFRSSDKLVVEVNILKLDPLRLGRLMIEKGMYPPGESLENSISKETLGKLEAVLKEAGLTMAAVSAQRPWLASMRLTMRNLQKLGYSQELGIDRHFLIQATDAKKEILELETAERQIDMLAEWPKGLQDIFLLSTLEEFSQTGDLMAKMVEDWEKGDAKALDQLVRKAASDNPKLEPIMKKLFDDRNVKMLSKIEKYLKSDRSHFVVVGAGHMVGEKGLVQLLRDKGLKVEQMAKSGARVPATAK